MLDDIKTPDRAEGWLKEQLAKKAKIMGFGHRVYKKGDSRVPIMREIGRDLGKRTGKEQWIPICEKLEETMEREKHLCANVDLYAAPVFTMLGFPPELNTPIFAASRVAGWCAHVVEQHDHNRLIRPRSLYTGPELRPVSPRAARGVQSCGGRHDPTISALIERRYKGEIESLQGNIRAAKCVLGLRPGQSGWLAHPQFSERRRSRGRMEAGEKIRSVSRSFERRNHRDVARLPLQLDGRVSFDETRESGSRRRARSRPNTRSNCCDRRRRTSPVYLSAKIVDLTDDRATVEGTLTAGGKVCATCRGVFRRRERRSSRVSSLVIVAGALAAEFGVDKRAMMPLIVDEVNLRVNAEP